jgi:hypothetical protein
MAVVAPIPTTIADQMSYEGELYFRMDSRIEFIGAGRDVFDIPPRRLVVSDMG